MLRTCLAALAAATLALPAAPLMAQESAQLPAAATPLEAGAQTLITVLNGTAVPEEAFTAGLLAAVPYAQIAGVAKNLTGQFGPATGVEAVEAVTANAGIVTIRFERALALFQVSVDPADGNRMNGLLVQEVTPVGDTPEKIAAELAALPGSVNAWFGPLDGGAPVIDLASETPLALGSAFKLYVLAALAEDIRAGKRRWDDVVPLAVKSYPSGKLQDWPEGAPLTLHTLAALMISISDNTATDQLIGLLGRERVLKLMKDTGHGDVAVNDPFLTTRELFLLKGGDKAQLAEYRAGNAAARAAILARIGENPLSLNEVNAAFAGGPVALDVEWLASPRDLAALFTHMRKTADPKAFAIMAINQSATPSIKEQWDYIGFKGGSEPGVLNLTWLLRDRDGAWHMLTLGWNNPDAPVNERAMEAIAQRILLLPR